MHLKMKKLTYPIILLLLASFVIAEGLEIKLIQYDSQTDYARIQIVNRDKNSLHDIKLTIDNQKPTDIVQLLGPGNAVVKSFNIPTGSHKMVVSSKEGITLTKDIQFSKSSDEVKQDAEKRKLEQQKSLETQDTASHPSEQQVTDTDAKPENKENNNRLIIIIAGGGLIILLGAGFIFWYFKLRKSNNKIPKDSVPIQPVKVNPSEFRTRTPEQMRQIYSQKQKQRSQMLNQMMKK